MAPSKSPERVQLFPNMDAVCLHTDQQIFAVICHLSLHIADISIRVISSAVFVICTRQISSGDYLELQKYRYYLLSVAKPFSPK